MAEKVIHEYRIIETDDGFRIEIKGDKERIRKWIEGRPRHRHKRWRKRAYGPFPPDMMFMRGHHGPEDFTFEMGEEEQEEASKD